MAVLPILTYPDPRLRQKAEPVAEVTPEIRSLVADMFDTMRYEDRGMGLAGNQVGVLKRIIVIDIGPEYNDAPLTLINPEVLWRSDQSQTFDEACLSVPEQSGDVTRPDGIQIRYLDGEGKTQELTAHGLLATCIQHEIDHIDGILFPERIPLMKRKMIYSRTIKAVKRLVRKR